MFRLALRDKRARLPDPILATSNSACTSPLGNVRSRRALPVLHGHRQRVSVDSGWLLTGNRRFLVGLVLASALVSDWLVRVHDAIHNRSQPLIQRAAFFAFLDVPIISHVDTEANVNFLLPLADWFSARCDDLEPPKNLPDMAVWRARLFRWDVEPARQVARPRGFGTASSQRRARRRPVRSCSLNIWTSQLSFTIRVRGSSEPATDSRPAARQPLRAFGPTPEGE